MKFLSSGFGLFVLVFLSVRYKIFPYHNIFIRVSTLVHISRTYFPSLHRYFLSKFNLFVGHVKQNFEQEVNFVIAKIILQSYSQKRRCGDGKGMALAGVFTEISKIQQIFPLYEREIIFMETHQQTMFLCYSNFSSMLRFLLPLYKSLRYQTLSLCLSSNLIIYGNRPEAAFYALSTFLGWVAFFFISLGNIYLIFFSCLWRTAVYGAYFRI